VGFMMTRYIIVGNGVAGTTAAERIRENDGDGKIDIFTGEPVPFYTRIRLPDYLAGTAEEKDIVLHRESWYEGRGIELHLEEAIEEIDRDKREVRSSGGNRYGYDRVLLATGGHSFIPPIQGVEKEGVFALRSIGDARRIKEYAKRATEVLVIGGGLLGLEAGNGLRRSGLSVLVVEFFPRLLPRQMDLAGADLLKRQMEKMGFTFSLGAKSKEILGRTKVEGLALEDGTSIPCNMILISAGVRPNLKLAQGMGLEIDKGVVVNDRMETEIASIYAAGDLVQHRGRFYGIWPAAERQGEVAGMNMAGGEELYEGTVMSNRLKVVGIDLVSSGEIDVDGQRESLVTKDEEKYIYRKLIFDDGAIIGCILLGDVRGNREILSAIEQKKDVTHVKAEILKDGFDFKRLGE
jgi:nitrite reductase (NADH) large subunit